MISVAPAGGRLDEEVTVRSLRFLRRYDLMLWAVLVCSISLNVYQSWRIGALSAKVGPQPLASGIVLPPLHLTGKSATKTIVDPTSDSRPMLLYVYSPRCGICKHNAPKIRALARRVADRYRLVALTLTDTGGEVELGVGAPFEAYSAPDAATVAAYALNPTPSTYVIGPSGRLQRHWLGEYTGQTASQVERFFDVSLQAQGR